MNENKKPELQLEPVEGEVMPVGKMPVITESENKALIVLSKAKKIDVLANDDVVVGMVNELKSFFAGDIEDAKKAVATITTKAALSKEDEKRLIVYRMRQGFKTNTDAFLSGQKALLKSAAEGKKKIEGALSEIEDDFSKVLADKKTELEAEADRKKAIADALTKLKNYVINPLVGSDVIEAAIDDFRLAFGDSDYQESQDAADVIFEAKMAEFEAIMAAAVVREENERKVKEQEEQARQRANINVTFPLAEISGYGSRSAADIQARIDWTVKIDMSGFELVAGEAETAKQSCLKMLNTFLPMAVAREEKEAADKAEAERIKAAKLAIEQIANIPNAYIGKKSGVISEALKGMINDGIGLVWYNDYPDFKNEAELTLKAAIERLTVILDGTLKKEHQDDWDEAIKEDALRAADYVQKHLDSIPVYRETESADVESAVIELINDDANFVFVHDVFLILKRCAYMIVRTLNRLFCVLF